MNVAEKLVASRLSRVSLVRTRRALAHPTAWAIFLGALVLLVVNDHCFKAKGALPPWLGGKLSDVAGLIVLPVALALLIGARRVRLRWLVFAAIAAWFAAINLSQACSELSVRFLGELGVSWTLWPDASDLVALLVLPLAWRVAGALVSARRRDRTRVMALPAAFACLASGNAFHASSASAAAFVYNDTKHIMAIDVANVPWLACEDLDEFGEGLYERSDFESLDRYRQGRPLTLAPAAVQTLSHGSCGCDLYRVTVGGRSIVVRVPPGDVRVDRHPTRDQFRHHKDRMLIVRDDFSFRVGSELEVVEVARTAKAVSCGIEPPAMAFSVPFTYSVEGTVQVRSMALLDVQPVAGNCFEVTLQSTSIATGQGGAVGAEGEAGSGLAGAAGGGGAPARGVGPNQLFLCAPRELFPFVPGDVVDISVDSSEQGGGGGNGGSGGTTSAPGYGTLNVQDPGRGFTMRLGELPSSYELREGSCGPVREEDGPPWRTVNVFAEEDTTEPLVPGEIRTFERQGETVDVYLGRSREVFGCVWQPGTPRVELVERWSK